MLNNRQYVLEAGCKVYLGVARGCERSAETAATCKLEAEHGESSHSPEFFEGFRQAMLAVAENCRIAAHGLTLPPEHEAEVIPIDGGRKS